MTVLLLRYVVSRDENYVRMIFLLLSVYIDILVMQGYTPLHAAASMGQTAVVADLLEADANVSET